MCIRDRAADPVCPPPAPHLHHAGAHASSGQRLDGAPRASPRPRPASYPDQSVSPPAVAAPLAQPAATSEHPDRPCQNPTTKGLYLPARSSSSRPGSWIGQLSARLSAFTLLSPQSSIGCFAHTLKGL